MNLNLHANFLTALLKLSGIEPTIDGLTISPRLPLANFAVKTPIFELGVNENDMHGSYTQQSLEGLTLRVKLPQNWIGRKIHCFIDDFETPFTVREDLAIGETQAQPRRSNFKFRLSSSP
jgi:hypothetical protein